MNLLIDGDSYLITCDFPKLRFDYNRLTMLQIAIFLEKRCCLLYIVTEIT